MKPSSKKVKRIKRGGFSGISTGPEKKKRVDDIVDLLKLVPEYTQLRLVGPVYAYAVHWIDIITDIDKKVSIPKVALNFDSEAGVYIEGERDPYLDIPNERRMNVSYYTNAIVRDLQDEEPKKKGNPTKREAKTGFKEKGSKFWSPVRVVKVTQGVASQLQKLADMNGADISDPGAGCDIYLSFDRQQSGTQMYNVQKGDKSPLTDEEREYMLWDVSKLMEKESLEEAKKEAKQLAGKAGAPEPMEVAEVADLEDLDFMATDKEREKARKKKLLAKTRKKREKREAVADDIPY